MRTRTELDINTLEMTDPSGGPMGIPMLGESLKIELLGLHNVGAEATLKK